ncbi:MAG: DUF424 family protein [Nanoarchaeota archaeon]|nr:DUF424 family protein [Nanoarchaeota archaeon]
MTVRKTVGCLTMYVNVIRSHRDIIAVCDKELLGKIFEEDKFQLDIKENFYKGKEATEEEVIEILRSFSAEDATFNIVGKRSIATALKTGVIAEETINEIDNIPFALVLS